MNDAKQIEAEWRSKLLKLTNSAWRDAKINGPKVDSWLGNFGGSSEAVASEQHHALHLLQQVMYFGDNEIRECLRAAFRDHVFYPMLRGIRSNPGFDFQHAKELIKNIRFLGVGGPSESGQGMLTPFRRSNELSTDLFPFVHDLLAMTDSKRDEVTHVIYFDDLCATGQQVRDRVGQDVAAIRAKFNNPGFKIWYLLLFATHRGVENVTSSGLFDEVKCVIQFDKDYQAFCDDSWCYQSPPPSISRATGKKIMKHYGETLANAPPLGYRDSQLLVAFHHNTPDNTLPVFWYNETPERWRPFFLALTSNNRYRKWKTLSYLLALPI